MSPYREALAWISQSPDQLSATGLAKLILSLGIECHFSLADCLASLSGPQIRLAMRIANHYAEHGNEHELDAVTDEICRRYPRLLVLDEVMTSAAAIQTKRWQPERTAPADTRNWHPAFLVADVPARSVQLIDPQCVAPSRWHARLDSAFQTAGFGALKNSLAHTGGNLVPVHVRPEGDRYVLAYGVLRRQACAELGLPVLAIVDPNMTEHELVGAMLAEAQGGTPLSPYELGMTVQSMLNAGLLPSRRRAAEHLGLMLKDLSGALAIASLPAAVLAAFDCPTQIRAPWAPKLLAAYERDPAGFPHRVAQVRAERVRSDARALFLALTADE